MFFGYKMQINKKKYFINLGCSHAASYQMPVEQSYPFLLANMLDLGYKDYAYSRTSLEYSEYALNSSHYSESEFVLWQLTYPWRKHNWNAVNRQDARIDFKVTNTMNEYYEDISLKGSFKIYANLLQKYKSDNIFFFFIDQSYLIPCINDLCKLNNKLYPKNINFIDKGYDSIHGGPKTQQLIADSLFEFIKNYDKKN